MLSDIAPFRMIGNLYFVGTYRASCHLIDTGDGLILIDTGYAETGEVILDSMKELGFDIKDVKIIIHSHGHRDHTGSTAMLVKLSGAKTYMNVVDNNYIRDFTPDFDIKTGTVIKLGNTVIDCIETPGHTPGTVSFFFDVAEGDKVYRAAMFGGAGVKQLRKDFLTERGYPLSWRDDFFASIDKVKDIPVDVFVANHSWQNHTREKCELRASSKENPFINPNEWNEYLTKVKHKMQEIIAEENQEAAE